MKNNRYQSKEFIALKEHWYKKLEKSGFKDVEQDEDHLKQWDAHAFNSRYDNELFNSREKYYQLAGQFLYDNEFRSKRERAIWEYHSTGYTVRAIEAELKKRNFKITAKSAVSLVIIKLEKEMLDKYAKEDD